MNRNQPTNNDIINALLLFNKCCVDFIISDTFFKLHSIIESNNEIKNLIDNSLDEDENPTNFETKLIKLIDTLKPYENTPQYKEAISTLTSLITETIKTAQKKSVTSYLSPTVSSDAKRVKGGKTKRNRKRKTINMRRKQTRAARNNVQVIRGGVGESAAAAAAFLALVLIAAYKCTDETEKEKNKTKLFHNLGHKFLGWSAPTDQQRGYFGCIYEKTVKYTGYSICIVGSIFVFVFGVGFMTVDFKLGTVIASYPGRLLSQIQAGLPAFNSKFFQEVSNVTAVAQTTQLVDEQFVDETKYKTYEKLKPPKSPFDLN